MVSYRGARDQGPGPRALDRGTGAPLWAQLRADLMRRLEGGEFGELLPSEAGLAAQYEVSRHTVREAMRRLRAEGVLLGERGQVARLPAVPARPPHTLYTLAEVVERAGLDRTVEVRTLDVRTDADVAARLDLRPTAPLVHLERLHRAAGEPFALERSWMPAALAAPLLEADLSGCVYGELAKLGIHPWGGAEHLRAVVPTAEDRRILRIGPRVAAFSIDRQACAGGRFFEITRTLVRGDRADVYAEFTDRAGYQLNVLPDGARTAEPPSRVRLLARASAPPARTQPGKRA